MTYSVLSSTQFEQAKVLQVAFWVSEDLPTEDDSLDAGLSLDVVPQELIQHEDGMWSRHLRLTVNASARQRGKEEDLVRIQVVLEGGASSPWIKGKTNKDMETLLLANGVSALYSTARTYIEMLTSVTPVNRFTLPAIDPFRVIDEP